MRLSLRDLAMIPVMTAVTVSLGVLPQIPVPILPVPITLQTLGVMLAPAILGAWRGALSQGLFLALVAVGAPVLSGGRGGLQALVGPSAGYLLAFPLAAWLIGYLADRFGDLNMPKLLGCNIAGGVLLMHALGIPGMALVTGMPLSVAAVGALVFLPGDLVKAVVAAVLGVAVRRALATAGVQMQYAPR